MGVDFNKIHQKAEEERQKAASRNFTRALFWKPADGKNVVRLLPPWTDDPDNPNSGQFWREIYMHFGVGGDGENKPRPFPCPKNTPACVNSPDSKDCPICDEVARLRSTRDPSDAELAKDIRAKQQVYSNIVDMANPIYTDKNLAEWKADENNKDRDCPFSVGDTKVQVFRYGPMIFGSLLDAFTQNIDLTDPDNGHNIEITKTGVERDTRYQTTPVLTPSVLPWSGTKQLADVMPNLDEVNQFVPIADMLAALTGEPVPEQLSEPAGRAEPSQQLAAPEPTPEPAPAPQVAVQQTVTPVEQELPSSEEPPPCFKDLKTVSDADPECIGGDIDDVTYDPCPFFADCQKAKIDAAKPKRRTRRPAKKAAAEQPAAAPVPPPPDSVEAIEAELRGALE